MRSEVPQNQRHNYWKRIENGPRPIDILVYNGGYPISPKDMVGFIHGCQRVYQRLKQIEIDTKKPIDVVFVPERGAAPIEWAVQQLAEFEGKTYPFTPLLVGTETNIHTDQTSGISNKEKINMLNHFANLQNTDSAGNLINGYLVKSDYSNPVMIEEAQTGSTAASHADIMSRLKQHKLNLIVIVDSNTRRPKAKEYLSLLRKRHPFIELTSISAPMPLLDHKLLLDTIVGPIDIDEVTSSDPQKLKTKRFQMRMLVKNSGAKEILSKLVICAQYPRELEDLLILIHEHSDINRNASPQMLNIYSWLQKLLQESNDDNPEKADQTKILKWFSEFSHVLKEQ